MTKSLTYIELDVPVCTLSYGVAPCRARITGDVDPVGAAFDGATYLKRAGGLTGAADSKLLTFSCWLRRASSASAYIMDAVTALNGGTDRSSIVISGDHFYITGYNAAGTFIAQIQSIASIPVGPWVHVLASFDLGNPAKCHLYVDDVSTVQPNLYTNDTIDFTMPDWGVGALASGGAPFTGSMADLWFAPGIYLDLSIEANRRKFIDSAGDPVDLGANGNVPTGASPLVFFSGALAAWHTNKATGGGFTKVGTLTEDDFGTGERKCFNSTKTCQSRATFDPEDVTFRFAKPTAYLPREIDAIPSLVDVTLTPATISLGENIGTRATLTASFRDHPDSDTWPGLDKYVSERDYDPFQQGTFWSKFRARQPFLRGRSIRWVTGRLGDALEDMEVRHYVVDSFDGATPDGKYSLIAKDILKLAAGDRSQAPAMNTGFISADITSGSGSLTLQPTGVGNLEYPAAGNAVLGGNEIVTFTRSGDTMTLTARGQKNTAAAAHSAQDRVQMVLSYAAQDPADILNDLLVNYADGIVSDYIPLADWQTETETNLGRLYSADICEPTSVETLVSELVQQACLSIWWDDIGEKIRLQVLRGIVTDAATFSPGTTLRGTLTVKEQPEKRVSQVWVYFGQINPVKPLSNTDNYRSMAVVIDDEAEADYGSSVIKKIYSRWIPALGRTVADRLGAIQLGRYRDPPRKLTFDTQRYAGTDLVLGIGYRVEAQSIQDETGAPSNIPIQITRLNPPADRFKGEAEEMLFAAPEDDRGRITVDSNINNINLRTVYDSLYSAPVSGDVVTCTINSGVIVGSADTSLPGFNVGTWPAGVTINLIVLGRISGRGGAGGTGAYYPDTFGSPGLAGGPALYTRCPINLSDLTGQIFGGGGGGGGGGGTTSVSGGGGGGGGGGVLAGGGAFGGAAGSGGPAGDGGSSGGPINGGAGGAGTSVGGAGTGGIGNSVGFAGVAGADGGGAGGAGGAAGRSVDGISFVTTISGPGDRRGPQIN